MTQESLTQEITQAHEDEHSSNKSSMLGPLLCWAVVFADIGTSIYYTPGILFKSVGSLAAFFVFLTMFVFVLLTIKYTEVTHRFPQGGGVVTVAAQALNPWFGALGGMFILVDYFLTAAISCLSGIIYLNIVAPVLGSYTLWITIGVLVLLGLLNWVGISESAKVSLVGAIIAFISDLAILFTVFSHISLGEVLSLFPRMFSGQQLTVGALLAGFAGSFLAFSGLESISQLSPVMKRPHKKVAGIAMLLVVLTIGLTSPLLTLFSTMLLDTSTANPDQFISLLAGHWGSNLLMGEVAISAGALLIFASNTAIIGAYHVFMALSRMDFLPGVILRRNNLRGTPHFAIMLATGIPILILIAVKGNIDELGDMYAFGLLGAFSLTCLGLDIVRFRDWRKAASRKLSQLAQAALSNGHNTLSADIAILNAATAGNGQQAKIAKGETYGLWFRIDFVLGVITTLLVIIAWSTNLVTKPLATAFGGGVTVLGLIIAFINYTLQQKAGKVPVQVVVTRLDERLPKSVLAVLTPNSAYNDAVIRAAVHNAEGDRPLIFLYLAPHKLRASAPKMMEIVDPYLEDVTAKEYFSKAESLAQKSRVSNRRYVYLQGELDLVSRLWQLVHPHDTVIPSAEHERFQDINPDRVRYEVTPTGKVAHLLKTW